MKSYLKNTFILFVLVSILIGCASGGSQQPLSPRAQPYFRDAQIFLQQSNFPRAMEYYLLVLENSPDHVVSMKTVADLYFMLADEAYDEEAIELFETAYDYYVRTIDTINGLADWTRYDGFENHLNDAELKLQSIFAKMFLMGQEYYQEEDFDAAEGIYLDLQRLFPERIESAQMLAAIANAQGDVQKAIGYFMTILEHDPTNSQILLNLAIEFQEQDDFDNARRYFLRFIEVEPENIAGHISLAYIEMQQEDYHAAFILYERAIEIEPENVDLISDAANIAQTIGDEEKVVHYLRRLVYLEENEENVSYLVYYLARMQNWEDLLTYARIWFNLNPEAREAVQFIIHSAYQQNNQEVLREFQEILNRME